MEQRPDLPAMEHRVLDRWRARGVFHRSLERTAHGPLFRFYEGPPTANGPPGVHHIEARVFKDVFPRYRTMKGQSVPRRAGWDCHGIPVELEVERELGLGTKADIEAYGVSAFNARCRESAARYAEEFARLTERIGYWVDTEDAYWTMSREYIQSVWWSLKALFDRGLVYEDDRVVPYCPRCGTALSDHEVAQGYRETEDPSIYVRFPVLTGPLAKERAHLLVWTTMPWTLVPATLAVIGPDIRYVLARGGAAGERPVVLAAERLKEALGDGAEVIREVSVGELAGARYRAPFDFVGPGSASDPEGDPSTWRYVVVDDFVKIDEGTGIVHTGAAFGEDDMRVARLHGAPVVKPVRPDGRFDERVGPYAGMDIRDADAHIVKDLERLGVLLSSGRHAHTYPFCWRCGTPLVYCARPCWYIATTRIRDRLLEENAVVDWRPPHIRTGRFGEWLEGNVDWALSRERYWGTPLPFWRCRLCARVVAVGSLAELGERAGMDLGSLDPHRPDVDQIEFRCGQCHEGTMRRVPEVIDAWYDSGAMPFAQLAYPHEPGSAERLQAMLPADYVCEGIDQTRGWFYSLLAISTMLFGGTSYRRVLCLGHIVDEEGRKMSTAAGNVLDPWTLIEAHGADALRWLFLVEGSPWQSRRIGDDLLAKVVRRPLLTLWNTYYFLVTYANLEGRGPEDPAPPVGDRPVLDRWILAELTDALEEVSEALSDFDVSRAGRRLSTFVDDLSNWYVRLTRRRFWTPDRGADGNDSRAAFATLYRCLTTVAGCLAPLTPFIADELYENLVTTVIEDAPDSVHLTDFPAAEEALRDDALRGAMALARRLVTLGRDARSAARIPVRRPLRRALLDLPAPARGLIDPLTELIVSELNVKSVELAQEGRGVPMLAAIRPNFRTLGSSFGRHAGPIAEAIGAADPESVAAALTSHGSLEVEAKGERYSISAEHVDVVEEPAPGWQVSSDGPYRVAIDLTVDRDLMLEGLARELVRLLNDLRKRRGLELGERAAIRIAIMEDPSGNVADMLRAHAGTIAEEVLAEELAHGSSERDSSDPETESDAVSLGDARLRISVQTVEEEAG